MPMGPDVYESARDRRNPAADVRKTTRTLPVAHFRGVWLTYTYTYYLLTYLLAY